MYNIGVSIILVNYNTCALTCACLDSIINKVHSCEYEIIVVDNASTDNSLAEFSRRYASKIVLIPSKSNLGFGRANNLGARYAKGKYLFLLNSDTILHNDPFPFFLRYYEQSNNIGCLGTFLFDANGAYTKSAGNFYSVKKYLCLALRSLFRLPTKEEVPLSEEDIKVEYVIGADLFISTALFKNIGGFDEHIFMYFEDVELCKRIYCLGYASYLIKGPQITHFVKASSTSQFSRIYNTASLMYCIEKERGKLCLTFFQICYFVLKAPMLLMINSFRSNFEYLSVIFKYKKYILK